MPTSSAAAASPGNSHNVVGVHYKVGKKIGEGSFGIIYEGELVRERERDETACTNIS